MLVAFVLFMALLPVVPGMLVGLLGSLLLSPRVPRGLALMLGGLLFIGFGVGLVRLMLASPINVFQGLVFLAGVAIVLVPRVRRLSKAAAAQSEPAPERPDA